MEALLKAAQALVDALTTAVTSILDALRAMRDTLDRLAADRAHRERSLVAPVLTITVADADGVRTYPDGTPVDVRRTVRRYVPRRQVRA